MKRTIGTKDSISTAISVIPPVVLITMSMSSTGYGPFDDYHVEFRALIRTIEERLRDQQQQQDTNVGELLKQCDVVLHLMKIEARSASGSSLKQELRDVHQACQMQLATYQSLNSQRDELFSGRSSSAGGTTTDKGPFRRLVATRNMAEEQNSLLDHALKSIRETEELAGEIGLELGRNRESIQRSQGNVSKLSGMLSQANSHLKGMTKKWPFG